MSAEATATTPQAQLASQAMGAPQRGLASRAVNRAGGGLVRVFLLVIALTWLVPTLGLFISSVRSAGDNASSGWWTFLTKPSQATFDNYRKLLDNDTIKH